MKRKIFTATAAFLFIAGSVFAADAPAPVPTSDGPVVSGIAFDRGEFNVNEPAYCHHGNGPSAVGWTNSEKNLMTKVGVDFLCPGVRPGEYYHPFQNGYLKLELAHPETWRKLQIANKENPGIVINGMTINPKNGNLTYIGVE